MSSRTGPAVWFQEVAKKQLLFPLSPICGKISQTYQLTIPGLPRHPMESATHRCKPGRMRVRWPAGHN